PPLISTLSLHDALPIFHVAPLEARLRLVQRLPHRRRGARSRSALARPELHIRRRIANLLGLVAQIRSDNRLRVRVRVEELRVDEDRKSTRLNSSHQIIS